MAMDQCGRVVRGMREVSGFGMAIARLQLLQEESKFN
jgi:hypothetical protein